MAEYADSDVQELADVIADAAMRGIRAGSATLARTILDAGWRRQRRPDDVQILAGATPPATTTRGLDEQLLIDERAETLLRVWLASWQGGLRDVPVDELETARGLTQQMLGTLDFAAGWFGTEGNAGGHGEASLPGTCGHDGCNHRRGHSGRHSWQEGDRG